MSILSSIAREEVRTDMTPMIDCVFLMIVFFVCIEFRQLEAKLPAYLPKDRGGSSKVVPREQLAIGVFAEQAGARRYTHGRGQDDLDPTTGRPPRFVLDGHEVAYRVGPTEIRDEDELLRRLEAIRADRSTWTDDPAHPGHRIPPPVVVELHPGTYYADAARAADVARKAGFAEIHFGGGLGALPARAR